MKFTPTLGGSYSGSLGGSVASHNKGGPYFRRRAIPTNPNSARQQAVRSALSNFVTNWTNALSDAQRTAWNTYASNVPRTDRIGQTIQLTGQQWYVACNTPRRQAYTSGLTAGLGVAPTDTAPTTFNRGENVVNVASPTFSDPDLTVTAQLSAAASNDGDCLLFIGPAINAGRSFWKGPYQLAAVTAVAADATSAAFSVDTSLTAQWASEHIPVVGARMPFRLVMVYDDARISIAYQEILTIAAGA